MDEREYMKGLSEFWSEYFDIEENAMRAAIAWEIHGLRQEIKLLREKLDRGIIIDSKI